MTSSECSKTAMRFSVYGKGKYGTRGKENWIWFRNWWNEILGTIKLTNYCFKGRPSFCIST